ncbi:MAG TPA: hypothetical protein VIN08_01280 [Ohtaekwangia sp.]|uniref:hypothetical protein n=1 Tax=Ohtaekwangia sp. TaxID=2066019 RepID=UPI002F92CCC4
MNNRKLIIILFLLAGTTCCQAQDIVKKRTDLVWNLVKDLKTNVPYNQIYATYLEDGDYFPNADRRKVGNDWNDGLKRLMNDESNGEVEVYQYASHPPDSALTKRGVGDPEDRLPEEYRPLQFWLNRDKQHQNLPVNINDIYVVRLKNKVLAYVLFNDSDKMITYGAVQILNIVWLCRFQYT